MDFLSVFLFLIGLPVSSVFFLNPVVNLTPKDTDFCRSLYPQANLLAMDIYNLDYDIITDHDGFT